MNNQLSLKAILMLTASDGCTRDEQSPVQPIVMRQCDEEDTVIDLPKAAHFNAFKDGKLLPPLDQLGLNLRWELAGDLRERGINMLQLSLGDRIAIGKACATMNRRLEKIGVVIQMRLDTEEVQDNG